MPLIGMAGSTVMMLPGLQALQLAIDLEFEAFELFGEFPQCVCDEVSPGDRKKGRAMVEDSGIALAVHAPFTSLNPAAVNPGIRKESVRQIIAAIDLCAELAGKVVITHTGEYVISERAREKIPQAATIHWQNNLESLKTCAQHAALRGITLCLENIGFEPEHLDRNVEDLIKIRDEVLGGRVPPPDPILEFCLDLGHARLNRELPQAISKLGPHIRHVHFTDNLGEKDDHLVIGQGNFDYSPHLDFFRSFPHVLTLEAISLGTDPAPAVKSREFVKKLLGS